MTTFPTLAAMSFSILGLLAILTILLVLAALVAVTVYFALRLFKGR